jgi:FkbM family methyltransferase
MMIAKTLKTKWGAFSYYAGGHPRASTLLRWGVWGIRCLLRLPATVDIAGLGMRLYLVPRWKGCWKSIFVFRERFFDISDPEWRFVEQVLRPGGVFVDAGAFQGWYTLVASRVVGPQGLAVAFEPNPDAYAILKRNVALNGRRNVRIFNCALSDADGGAVLYRGPDDGVASSLGPVPGGRGQDQVTTRRLDDVVEELKIRKVDFMKVDVEGAEARLLGGAVDVLRESTPVVLFEVYPAVARNIGVSERAAWDFLGNRGYAFFALAGTGLVPLPEFPSLQDGAFLNVVAIPQAAGVEIDP